MIYSGGVIDFVEARRRLSAEFERNKETETKLLQGKAIARYKSSVEPASRLKPALYFLMWSVRRTRAQPTNVRRP
jgi:hypothetical protein